MATLFSTAIEQASNNTAIIENNKRDYKTTILNLIPETILFTRMKIIDVPIDQGIIANCSVNLSNQENATALGKKYIDRISQISIQFGSENNITSLTLYSTGSIIVYRDRDDIPSDVIDAINALIGGIM